MTFAQDQNDYADVIQALGESSLADGQTLSNALTLEGIPFWEVFAAENAWRHMTTAVSTTTLVENAKYWIKPSAMRARETIKRLAITRWNDSGCSSWPSSPVVLCMGLTPRMYRDVLEPVAQYLAISADCQIVVLGDALTQLSDVRDADMKISDQTLWHHWGTEARALEKDLIGSLERLLYEVVTTKGLKELVQGLGSHWADAAYKMLNLFFRCYLPQIVPQAALAKHILARHTPAFVLSPDTSDARVRLYTLLATKMGVPTLEVQFGLAGAEAVEWRFCAADFVSVWGKESQDALLRQKVESAKILLTGSPRYDSLVAPSPLVVKRQRERLGVMDSRKIILLASTYVDKTHSEYAKPEVLLEMKRAIFDAIQTTPEVLLVVKPHPHEDVESTRILAGQTENIVFADRVSDIRELIIMSDAFISFGSTATIDALAADKLTICPIFPGWPFSETFRASGAVCVPETGDEIISLFSMIAEGELPAGDDERNSARVRYLERILYKLDGQASSRIGQHIIQMAKLQSITTKYS